MTTKDRIIEESLTLFSTKGYKGTTVKDIANAVGIKDSSIYKHFQSKQDILTQIVTEMLKKMEDLSIQIGLPKENDFTSAAAYYGMLTTEGLIELGRQIFLFYLKNPFIARFRRLATIEQYQNQSIYQIYHNIFMNDSISYQTALFQEMINQKIFIQVNPEVMAINFYTPIFFLLNKYDQEPELEDEALKILERQLGEFCRIYKKNDPVLH